MGLDFFRQIKVSVGYKYYMRDPICDKVPYVNRNAALRVKKDSACQRYLLHQLL